MADEAEEHDRRAATEYDERPSISVWRRRRVLAVALAVGLAVAVGLTSWLLHSGGESSDRRRGEAALVSARELSEFAASLGHPVYWAGPQAQLRYELTHTSDGRVYIRYLPAGVEAGDPRANFLTVGTYPQENAFATLRETANAQGVETLELPRGGLAFQDATRPTSVYLAYPQSGYQVEVYAPVKDTARTLAGAGQIRAIGAP